MSKDSRHSELLLLFPPKDRTQQLRGELRRDGGVGRTLYSEFNSVRVRGGGRGGGHPGTPVFLFSVSKQTFAASYRSYHVSRSTICHPKAVYRFLAL